MNLLSFITMAPPLFLLFMIYQADKVEKEPAGRLIRLFVLGMLSCIPAAIIEGLLCGVLDMIMPDANLLYLLIENFLIIAMAEEGVKYLITKTQTWNHKAFDYRFDGIVYAVVVSLGFAFFENIFYVFGDESAFVIAGMRAITSIPGHCTFGIMMGYYYGEAKYAEKHGKMQECKKNLKFAYLIPLLLHGFYDFILSTGMDLLFIIFIIYVIWLDLRAYRRVKNTSKYDIPVGPEAYGQPPYGQPPYGQQPYGQDPFSQDRRSQDPFSQDPFDQNQNQRFPR